MTHRTLATCLAVSLIAVAAPAHARECEGATFPDSVTVDGQRLVLNGLGVREATIFNVNVYVAGIYVERRSRNGADLHGPDQITQLVLKFIRDVSQDTMNDGIERGFRVNAGDNLPAFQGRIRQLRGMIPDLDEGLVLTFTYRPGQGVEVKVGNQVKGVIEGADFAEVFFNIWLGPNPPNRGLRRGLLGGECDG
jgi:hypothetical protein